MRVSTNPMVMCSIDWRVDAAARKLILALEKRRDRFNLDRPREISIVPMMFVFRVIGYV